MALSVQEQELGVSGLSDQNPNVQDSSPQDNIYPILIRRDTEEIIGKSTRFPEKRAVAVLYPGRPKTYISWDEAVELAAARDKLRVLTSLPTTTTEDLDIPSD